MNELSKSGLTNDAEVISYIFENFDDYSIKGITIKDVSLDSKQKNSEVSIYSLMNNDEFLIVEKKDKLLSIKFCEDDTFASVNRNKRSCRKYFSGLKYEIPNVPIGDVVVVSYLKKT